MPRYDYDLFTIGAGSGGTRASRLAAAAGMRVAVAEERFLGGTCVNVGCVPKKLLVYASGFADAFEDARGFGWDSRRPAFDWPTFVAHKNAEIERLNGVYERLLVGAGAEIIRGRAVFVDAHTVEINGERKTAERFLVAVGARPTPVPGVPGTELAKSSDAMFYLEQQPRHIAVIGGGYIGVEFAGIFNGLGSKVTQIHRGGCFLRGFDDDLRNDLAAAMRARGIDLRFDTTVDSIARVADDGGDDDELSLTLSDGSTLRCDEVLCATGRHPNTAGLGLEAAGVELGERGAIVVNDRLQSSAEHIYALGDVIDRAALTPVAIAEAMCFIDDIVHGRPRQLDYSQIATAVFSQPELGTVGLTEAAAREAGHDVEIYRARFRPMLYTISGREERTMMKLVVDKASDRVLGCHMLGPSAGEIVQCLAIPLKMGATKAQFDATIAVHPTASEEFVTMRTPAS